ncbi:hypothetical protein L1785_15035 [Antribacter sp. KLBMP9083]|uniref:Isoprenylcysteine carboxylmethyltransferase family protein n=1 Tax=Antribacter soli TaxID=2910976 RepID=A0AA41QHK5_9MICO|nr:isoprenylcysteine carboxylmethyltransferase family protein [Antribacter soli]MCF4122292.1 hypothetical protein [Antribacter soli]
MTTATLVRGLALMVPLLAVVLLCARRPPTDRETGAVITATAWVALVLLPVNLVASSAGWWRFAAEGAVWHGIPIDLWLGWSLLWGAVPALALRGPAVRPVARLALTGAALVWTDLALMPLGEPVVVLGGSWLVGEAVAVATALVPALFLADATLRRRHLAVRAWAQALWAGGLVLVVPVAALAPEPRWPAVVTTTGVQLVLVACLPGLAAMRELAAVGGGTPLPYDPPARLVVSGPYAYVRNPMQASVAVAYAGLALVLGDPRSLVGTLVVVAYSAGLAAWHEGDRLRRDFGDPWSRYRRAVPAWLPAWRPRSALTGTLWVAADCDLCTGVARWFAARDARGLAVRPAAEHPDVLYRITYEAPGIRVQGISAVARALGHVHLGWALAGWALDVPVVRHFAQLCADAFGGGPRPSRGSCVTDGARRPPRAA